MRKVIDHFSGLAETLGVLVLLGYGIMKGDWQLLALTAILIQVTRIRGVLTGDEYEAFLRAEKEKRS